MTVRGSRPETWLAQAGHFVDQHVERHAGAVPGPFDARLLLRGLRTLHLRVEQASSNALAIAGHLEGHPAVERALYPGLASHRGHDVDVACRQMSGGFGSMLSILSGGGAGRRGRS
jgi:cystathionine gamma-synthase